MTSPEDQIQKKLAELETQLKIEEEQKRLEEASAVPAVVEKTTGLVPAGAKPVAGEPLESDLYLMGGLGCVLVGILIFFSHIKVGTPFLSSWMGLGHGGVGFLLLPLLVGLGMLFYDYRSALGWVVTGASVVLILFEVLSGLIFTFPYVSLVQIILMLVPIAAGVAMIGKSVRARRATQEKSK